MHSSRSVLSRLAAGTAVAVALGVVPAVAGAPAASALPTGLLFTEYVEGSGNNKAVEIYNGTSAAVDLGAGGYNVKVFSNGGTTATPINLAGTVAPGDVFVLGNSNTSNDPAILAADQLSGSVNFNGNDAVALLKGADLVDVIGQIGLNPGTEWGTGDASTADNTIRRKASVSTGDANGSDAFDPAVEWDGFPTNTFDGLGAYPGTVTPADDAPVVTSTDPSGGNNAVATDAVVTVTFSEPVTAPTSAFSLACSTSGTKTLTVTGGPTTFSLDPTADFVRGDACTLMVIAANVSDVDVQDPPDHPAADLTVGFSVPLTDPCDASVTPIPAIQGSGATAAVTGAVTTRGVVVGDYEGPQPTLRGFYLQDATGDGNAATSDGIFVFDNGADLVALGDVVTVSGTAGEYQGQTQISSSSVTGCGTGTVAPTDVTFPVANDTYLERYEGMLVELPQTMSVTEHYLLGRFGQVTLSQGGRLQQPTNVVAPGAPAAALQAENDLRTIILDDTTNDQNADPIVFGRGGQPLSASNTLRGGDTVTGLTGVLNYTWGGNAASGNAYRVRPAAPDAVPVDFAATNPRPATSPAVGGTTRVAGMNLLNFFNTLDSSSKNCTGGVAGPPIDCRGANTDLEFERQWRKTVAAVSGTGADVVAFMEMENDGYGPASAEQFLVDRLNDKDGAGTWALIDADAGTGQVDALGNDAIKVGMLYKPAEVTPVGKTAALNTEAFVNGGDTAPRNRPALAQAFRDNTTGGTFVASANHLKSKGSACAEPDSGDGQANCNAVRVRSAQLLADWLASDPTGTGDPDVLILGDLNSYAKEDPITTLEAAGYRNLIEKFNGSEAYSYAFDGQWGYLDHALGNAAMTGQVTGVVDWHVNADEPGILDYNTEFKSAGQVDSLYAPTQFRISDHDPVLVGLDLTNDTSGTVTAAGLISSPAGAFPGSPSARGLGVLGMAFSHRAGATATTGHLAYSVIGARFAVLSTSVDSLVVIGNEARATGAARVNGASGFRYEVTATDSGRSDTVRIIVRDKAGSVVYDSSAQRVTGQVVVRTR